MNKKDLDELNAYGESLIADALKAKQSGVVEIPSDIQSAEEFVAWMTTPE